MSTDKALHVPGYHVLEYLGSGARSTIWTVRDQRTGQVYALKRVVKRSHEDHRFIEQAENEYAIASQLEHPAIRRCLEIRRIKSWMRLREVHLFMEFCPGTSLQQSRPAELLETIRIFLKVAKAIDYMNRQGFLHADMKPNNIIVAPDGSVKVIDLGQGCPVGTVKQRVQGTPDYIAPEQVYRDPLTFQTDVFNFGATLYWTLTGQAISTVLPQMKPGRQMLDSRRPKAIEEFAADAPAALTKLVNDCVEHQPSHRPASMAQVLARLEVVQLQIRRARGLAEGTGDGEAPPA